LSGQIAALNSYTANVNDATAWSSTSSAALQSIQQMVQTARTLVVEGGNGSLNQTNLTSIGDEISQLVADIKQTANTQYDGMYIFSGTATGTAPYLTAAGQDTFQGNTAAINRAIGPGTTVQVNANLSSVLGNGQAAADGGLLDTLETAAQDLTSGNTANLGNDLTSLDTNMTALEGVQTDVGAMQDRLEMASTRITALQTADQTQLGNTEDVDMARASINLSTEQAAYSAALQSGSQIIQTSLLNFLNTG
jgi:flagellar hook-associated protein 3 FlgL